MKWRLASSFPKSLDTLWGGAELFCRRVGELTDGKFKIQPFASGEIVPGFQVFDAVQNGTVELGQTAAYYYIGKDITFTFDTAVPFGLNSRQHVAWWMHGGGREAMAEFYKDYGVVGHLMGGTGAHMGGWFRPDPGQARRHRPANPRRRDLSGAGEGHDRCRRVGRALRRREARLSGLVGRDRHGHGLYQPEIVVAAGVKLQPFPTAVLEACFNATSEVCNEIVAKNPKFKKAWDNWKPYRSEQVLRSRIAEGGFDGFMARMYGAGKV